MSPLPLLLSCLLASSMGLKVTKDMRDLVMNDKVMMDRMAKEKATKHMPVSEDEDIDEETLADLEALIEHLDLAQLEQLQAAIAAGAEGPKTEFEMISEELRAMGLDEGDIEDLKMMAGMMHEFLLMVPDIEGKLEMEAPHDLLDHVQLYLLGLPNKLGPLGFLALHHILEEEEEEEEKEVAAPVPTPEVRSFRRRRQAGGGY